MNEKIRTAVNVAAVILVPLINERQKLKEHPDYIKAKNNAVNTLHTTKDVAVKTKDKTVSASQKAVHTAVDVKDKTVAVAQFVAEKKAVMDKKHEEKKIVKAEKRQEKETEKLNQLLTSEIEKRRKEEDKQLKVRQKDMISAIKQHGTVEKKQKDKDKEATRFVRQKVVQQQQQLPDTKNIQALVNDRVLSHEYETNVQNAPLFNEHRRLMAEHIRRRNKY